MTNSARSSFLCGYASSALRPRPSNLRVAGLGIGADPSGRPLLRRPGLLVPGGARPAVAIANPKVAILIPAKCPDELQSKLFMRRKGEEAFQSPLLADTFTRSMKASSLIIKPNCIVYIIQLQ